MQSADIVLYLFDVQTETSDMLQEQIRSFENAGIRYLLVANKYDNEQQPHSLDIEQSLLYISAKQQKGIEALKNTLFNNTVQSGTTTEDTIVTNARHYEALQQVNDSLTDIKNGLDNGLPGDLLALDIRRCLYYLGEITGEISNEDKLDYIFSKFCIGK